VWDGFWADEAPPSPKVQLQLVGAPVEASVNWTVRGVVPLVGVPEKAAGSMRESVQEAIEDAIALTEKAPSWPLEMLSVYRMGVTVFLPFVIAMINFIPVLKDVFLGR